MKPISRVMALTLFGAGLLAAPLFAQTNPPGRATGAATGP